MATGLLKLHNRNHAHVLPNIIMFAYKSCYIKHNSVVLKAKGQSEAEVRKKLAMKECKYVAMLDCRVKI